MRWQTLDFLVIYLQLDGEERGCVWADFEDGGEAEESHAAEYVKLFLFKAVTGFGGLRLD